jgi:eukaryotic-like serine/threonine-protein kinase
MENPMEPGTGLWIGSPTSGTRYQLGQPLGEGEFSVVFECTVTDGRFAAKCFRGDREDFPAPALWEKECLLARRARHQNVIALYDAFVDQGRYWMILERADGNLASLIQRHGPLPAAQVRALGLGLLRALVCVHTAGIVHRDTQIFNVLYVKSTLDLQAKLCDFGVSTWPGDSEPSHTYPDLWGDYELVPEYYATRRVTAQSDVYQTGYLLYYALTAAMALSAADGPPEEAVGSGRARRRALALGTPLGDCIAGMLHADPKQRFRTAIEALDCLERLPR